ncbi:MAG TPA: DNA primase [Myxococcaceae bacterium]|nr:DNA primase [Myxococcaceae bacterium]
MPIPEHTIDEILERVDLVALVGRHVELKKSGKSFKGRCPFHQEKSASFYVTPELKRFKCFGCQAGGDAIAFVQRYLGKTFVDAVRDLAREVGVDLAAAEDPSARERQHLREVTELALEHFKSQLWHATEGRLAREALTARGVGEETARSFGLGWAPEAWSRLGDLLLARGLLEFGMQAGLVQRRTRGEGAYDVFRGRLMIPIRAPDGRVVAFGGRLLVGDQGPKYLNSKESRLYNKSETLYGLDRARDEVRRRKSAVLVEGYFDVIGLHQAGVTHAVALCSTALTAGHLQQLQRVEARELVLLLDGDEAGRKAVERLAPALLAAGASTRVALLPEGEDPDTFARGRGAEEVRTLLAAAVPLSEHLFRTLLPEGRAASFERKMEALGRLRPVVAELPVGLLRSAFFSGLAAYCGLPAVELEAGLRSKGPLLRPVPKPAAPVPARVERPLDRAEGALGALFLTRPELIRGAAAVLDEVTHPGLRAVLAQLQAGLAPADALEAASPRLRTSLEAAQGLLPRDPEQLPEALETLGRRLKLARVKERLDHIARSTALLVGAHELDEETKRLQEERGELLRLKRQLEASPSATPTGSL